MSNSSVVKKVVLFILLLAAISFAGYAYYYSQILPTNKTEPPLLEEYQPEDVTTTDQIDVSDSEIVIPSSTPSPKPIPKGKRGFSVSMSSNLNGPRIGRGEIDPYDPSLNQLQKLTIEVNDTVPVESVTATLKTDNKISQEYQLSPNTSNQLIGNWTGQWVVDDSYLYTYVLTIKAVSRNGTSQIDVTLR